MRCLIGYSLAVSLLAGFFFRTSPAQAPTNSDPQIVIRLNQVGYRSADLKIAIAASHSTLPLKFNVINAETNQSVFAGAIKPITGGWGRYDYHAQIDFSALQKPGTYFVQIGETNSQTFRVSSAVYTALPDELLEFMRQQRCGYNPWLDAVCHSFDGRTAYGPLPAGSYVDARGGWHD